MTSIVHNFFFDFCIADCQNIQTIQFFQIFECYFVVINEEIHTTVTENEVV